MSSFVVSARKYRPARFDEVVGQEHVSGTLKNALKNEHLAHAFLFCGPRGVGKTTCARILAKVLNCESPTEDKEPCNECSSCEAFNQNASFNITELDAASNNSVEHIRTLIEQVRFQPQQGKYKIFIIDEVHMLSQQAFNAFLKTLEEPPPYAIFILATTEKHKIIPTILSRCQIFDFKRIQIKSIVAHLEEICKKEGIEADANALHIIAQKADGALRDALSIFDKIVAFAGKKFSYQDVIDNLNILDYDYYFKIVEALLAEDMSGVLLQYNEILNKGFDGSLFLSGLSEHLRDLLVCKDPETLKLLEASDDLKKKYQKQAGLAPTSFLLTALNILNDCDIEYKMARNKRLHVEMALIKITYIQRAIDAGNQTPVPEKKKPNFVSEEMPKYGVNNGQKPEEDTPEKDAPVAKEEVKKEGEPKPASITKINGGSSLLGSVLNHVKETHEEQIVAEKEIVRIEKTSDNLNKIWDAFVEKLEGGALKSTLKQAGKSFVEDKIEIRVGTSIAQNTIREEKQLIPYLRKEFADDTLQVTIVKDETKAPKPTKRVAPLNAKEKFIKMRAANPELQNLAIRFQLRPDED